MAVFRRRPLAVLICCLSAGTQSAWGADEAPLKLRVERKMLSVEPQGLPEKKDGEAPTFIMADQIEGRADEVTVAEGDVEVRKLNSRLYADKLTHRPLDDEVDAVGNVRLYQYEDEMRGPHLRMKISEQVGFFDDVDYRIKRETAVRFYGSTTPATTVESSTLVTNTPMMISVPESYGLAPRLPTRRPSEGYGHADRIDFEGENQVSLTNATYSLCKPDNPDWYLRAKEIHLDYDREVAQGSHATLYFKDLPIFYTPTGSFALNQSRKSGLLPAMLSTSTKNGFDLTVPYYWNLAPNYDMTFFPREITKRGLQLGVEGRYLSHLYQGTTRIEYMPRDDMLKKARWAYSLTHSHAFGQGLSAAVDVNGVSDDFYWTDLSSRLLQTTQTQLPRQLTLNYAPGSWWSASAVWLRYQSLRTDPAIPAAQPYFLEPQVNFSGRLPNLRGTDFSVLGQYSRFTHPTLVNGARTMAYPQLSLPIVHPAFSITPKIGVHATQYSLEKTLTGQPRSLSRVMPTFTLDSTVVLERETTWLGSNHIQTLEPRLYYVYIPHRDQSRIPVFDTGLSDFNFAQIFTENRYSGYDRINDANQVTAAVTTRFLDAETGAERFKAMVGQRYYLDKQKVVLPGETVVKESFSNTLLAFNGLVLPKTYLDSTWEYDNHRSRTDRFSIGARYQPDNAKVLSASYRLVRAGVGGAATRISQIDIAGQWPLTRKWYAVGRYNYSLHDKQLLEAVAGLEYNEGCWSARFVAQRLEAVAGTPNTTFFFQLELNDFASIGSSPIQLLRRSVPGYGKVNELPTTGSLLTSE